MAMLPVVRLEAVYKTYVMGSHQVAAVRGVDLEVTRGEVVAVMGRSGSGKSTLLNLIGTLDRPDRGRIWLDGVETTRMPPALLPHVRRAKLGIVFQSHNLIPTLKAWENVALPMRYAGVPRKEARRQAEAALEQVGLATRVHHRSTELSGGEQQRVAIARALALEPPLLLADEPTGSLDSENAADVLRLLRRLIEGHEGERSQRSVLMVTHDPLVNEVADRVLHISDGMLT